MQDRAYISIGGNYDDEDSVLHKMFRRFFNWIKGNPKAPVHPPNQQIRRRVSAHEAIRPAPSRNPDGRPSKRTMVKKKFHREDSGTHETLRIVDDEMVAGGENHGVDPYNSGEFDRSKNWDVRFRS